MFRRTISGHRCDWLGGTLRQQLCGIDGTSGEKAGENREISGPASLTYTKKIAGKQYLPYSADMKEYLQKLHLVSTHHNLTKIWGNN